MEYKKLMRDPKYEYTCYKKQFLRKDRSQLRLQKLLARRALRREIIMQIFFVGNSKT